MTNVDQAVIIFALSEPEPNFNLLDRFLIMMAMQGVSTIICLNKSDLKDASYGEEKKAYMNRRDIALSYAPPMMGAAWMP